MNNQSPYLHKASDGAFYILGPGRQKIKIDGTIEQGWQSYEKLLDENLKLFAEAGLSDENGSFSISKILQKKFWVEQLIKSAFLIIPMLLAFVVFSFIASRMAIKVTNKIEEALIPKHELSLKTREGFKRTVDHYRPYMQELLKAWHEESQKIKSSCKDL